MPCEKISFLECVIGGFHVYLTHLCYNRVVAFANSKTDKYFEDNSCFNGLSVHSHQISPILRQHIEDRTNWSILLTWKIFSKTRKRIDGKTRSGNYLFSHQRYSLFKARHIEAKTRQFIKDILNGDVKDTLQLQIDASQPVRTSSVKTWSMAKWLQMSLKSANSIFCSLSKPSRPVIFPISARIWRKISRLQFSQTT